MLSSATAELPQLLQLSDPDGLDGFATDYYNLAVSRYMGVAGGCMAVYDHILSFPDELEVIWKAPFSTVNAIYIFNRISLPIILALHQYDYDGFAQVSDSWCKVWLAVEAGWTFCCLISIHWLMTIRVWVFTGRKPTIFRWLVGLYALAAALTVGILCAGMSLMVPAAKASPLLPICSNILPPFMLGIWFPFAFLEIGMFIMTIRTYREHAAQKVGLSSSTPLLDTLWRDGFIYFIVVLSGGIFNIVVWAAAPGSLKLLARHFTFSWSVIAASHLVLSIRMLGRQLQQLDSLTITGLPTGIGGRTEWANTVIDWARSGDTQGPDGEWAIMDRPEAETDDNEGRYDIELVGSRSAGARAHRLRKVDEGDESEMEDGLRNDIVDFEVSTPSSSRPLMIHPVGT